MISSKTLSFKIEIPPAVAPFCVGLVFPSEVAVVVKPKFGRQHRFNSVSMLMSVRWRTQMI
jgi:hypothetical protein